MTFGKRKTNQQQELAAAVIAALQDTGILESLKNNNHSSLTSRLAQLYAVTPQPRIDGRLTWADLVTTGGFVIVSSGTGLVIGFSSYAASGNFSELLFWWGKTTQISATLALVRISADLVNIAGIWEATFGKFLNWLEEQKQEPQETIRFVQYSGPELEQEKIEPRNVSNRVFELTHPDGQIYEMSYQELTKFLDVASQLNDWTRDGWCGSKRKPGRGMSQPVWKSLETELTKQGVWKADRPTIQRFVEQELYSTTNETKNE